MRGPSRDTLAIAGMSFAFLLVHLGFTSQNYTYADDSLPFAACTWLGHAPIVHHLILQVLWQVDQWLGFSGPHSFPAALALMKGYVALTSFLALNLIGHLSRRWFGSLKVAILTMLAISFTYGYWCYSIVPDVYIEAVAFVLLSVTLAERAIESATLPTTILWLGLTSLAVLWAAIQHQSECLIVVPIALVLAFARRAERPTRERFALAAGFLALTAMLGFATYLTAFRLSGSPLDFVTWIRGYTAWMQMLPDDHASLKTPLFIVVGIARAIVYPELALHFSRVYAAVHGQFPLKLLMDDRYLSHSLPDAWVAFIVALQALVLLSLPVLAVRAVLAARRSAPRSPGFWIVLLWIPIQAPLFALWEPTSNEMWIWLLPCLGLLGGGLLVARVSRGWRRLAPWGFVLALFLANGTVVALYQKESNCIYRVNKEYLRGVGDHDLALAPFLYPSSWFPLLQPRRAPTFGTQEGAFVFDEPAFQKALAQVRARHGRIFLDPILAMPVDTEVQLLAYRAHTRRADVEVQLRKLEAYCRTTGIPLYAVIRRGGAVLRFEPCRFNGYVKWVRG